MRLYKVRVEWLLKGKGEKYQAEFYNVVAPTAQAASAAALKHSRDGWVEKLADIRVEEIVMGELIDVIAPSA